MSILTCHHCIRFHQNFPADQMFVQTVTEQTPACNSSLAMVLSLQRRTTMFRCTCSGRAQTTKRFSGLQRSALNEIHANSAELSGIEMMCFPLSGDVTKKGTFQPSSFTVTSCTVLDQKRPRLFTSVTYLARVTYRVTTPCGKPITRPYL